MAQPRVGKSHAVLPRGFSTDQLWWRLLYWVTNRSRPIRAFVFGLRPSRLRTALLARYYHRAIGGAWVGDFGFLRAFTEDAETTMWGLETYHGRDSVRASMLSFLDVAPGARPEVVEMWNPPGGRVLIALDIRARSASGVPLEEIVYLTVSVRNGDATRVDIFRSREEGFALIGLSAGG